MAGTSAWVLFLLLATARCVYAQSDNPWINKRVVQKSPEFRLKIDDEVVETSGKTIAFYHVERTDGPLLWLQAEEERFAGWGKADEVVPVEQAIAFFSQQIQAQPRDAFCYAMRALVRRDKNDLDDALKDLDQAIRLDPRNALFYCGRGTIQLGKKAHEKAIADYGQAIRLDPKCVAAYIGRGSAWRSTRRYDDAIADYSEAIWLDPLAIAAYDGRGRAWHVKKEYEKAVIDYDRLIQLDAQNASAYSSRGFASKALGRYGNALADFQAAIDLDSKTSGAFEGRASIWATCPDARIRDGQRALESATRACELTAWKSSRCLGALAAACAELGEFEHAVNWQTKANGMELDVSLKQDGEARLRLYRERKPFRENP